MIDLITRVRSRALYDRMLDSAEKTATDRFEAHHELDAENLPKLAATYNRLAGRSKADILGFVHDDIEFLSNNWDGLIQDLFAEYDADILGVAGTAKYEGGPLFHSGNAFSLGHFACEVNGVPMVKTLARSNRYIPAQVVDGMLLFSRRSTWEKEKFDETFDELFFYDMDFCLRGKVGVTDHITVKHSKPKDLYGKYPENLKPMSFYEPAFNQKHGFVPKPPGPQACAIVSLDDFERMGQSCVFDQFERKYMQPCVSR